MENENEEITIKAIEYATDHVIMRMTNAEEDRWKVSCESPAMVIVTRKQELAQRFMVEMEQIARTYFEMKKDAK